MNTYDKFRIMVDLPSESPGLGFKESAHGLASLIKTSAPQFTIAIFGPWGSGKTTLMQEIERQLKSEKVITVGFSAWRYEKEEHLIIPLLDTIRASLVEWSDKMKESSEAKNISVEVEKRRRTFSDAARSTAETVGQVMASVLAGLSFKVGVPGALDLSYDANKALAYGQKQEKENNSASNPDSTNPSNQTFSKRLSDPELPQSFYHACFSALTQAFTTFEKNTKGARIVVFVDDLDRCLPTGTLEVLESMKLFFDLKGFVFVVGLDREVVERCIDSRYVLQNVQQEHEGSSSGVSTTRIIKGSDYLKKIFQVPFSLAPVAASLLDDLFNSLQKDSGLHQDQVDDLINTVKPHLSYLFSGVRLNPREVKRFINAYTIQMKIKPDLSPNIVLALNTLDFRQDCRKIYDSIATFRVEFTSALNEFLSNGDDTVLDEFDISAMDIPYDIKAYLGPTGRANELLSHENIDIYLDAGESTRSSVGGYYLDLLSQYRLFRASVKKAINSEETLEFDGSWSEANSHYHNLRGNMMSMSQDNIDSSDELNRVEEWLDGGNSGNDWQKLLDAMNNSEQDDINKVREIALVEANGHLAHVRNQLQWIRQRASLEH